MVLEFSTLSINQKIWIVSLFFVELCIKKKPVLKEVLLRFPHIGEKIFNSLDNKGLVKCKRICRTWSNFIEDQKFSWIRIFRKIVIDSNRNDSQKLGEFYPLDSQVMKVVLVKEVSRYGQSTPHWFN